MYNTLVSSTLAEAGLSQLPVLRPYPGPRSVVVMDNCAIHHDPTFLRIVEQYAGQSHP